MIVGKLALLPTFQIAELTAGASKLVPRRGIAAVFCVPGIGGQEPPSADGTFLRRMTDTETFHKDRHPSLKLYDDHFYCFGCGATGDVIDFTAWLFGISTFEAVKKLAADFGIDPDKPLSAAALAKPRYPMIKAFREDELYCHRVLCDYLHLLENWKVRYAPKTPEEPWDERFTEALQMHDYIEYLADVLTVGELEERIKAVEILLKDGKMQELEARLERMKEEQENGRAV